MSFDSCHEKMLLESLNIPLNNQYVTQCELMSSVPSKVICCEIGPALWKIGSTDFVKISKKDAFSW